jgi:hypothetical protein
MDFQTDVANGADGQNFDGNDEDSDPARTKLLDKILWCIPAERCLL